jgi:hypothetical protein
MAGSITDSTAIPFWIRRGEPFGRTVETGTAQHPGSSKAAVPSAHTHIEDRLRIVPFQLSEGSETLFAHLLYILMSHRLVKQYEPGLIEVSAKLPKKGYSTRR